MIFHHCPIHKMLKSGITVNSQPAKESDLEKKKKLPSQHDE
jgi:hypothetical protein